MSWLLFVDESGHDGTASPYEVLAGLAIEERLLWPLICRIQDAEEHFFGQRISDSTLELKGRKLLKAKTFRLAGQMAAFSRSERKVLACSCLQKGRTGNDQPTRSELTALSQAKIDFVSHVLALCAEQGTQAFASIVPTQAPRGQGDFLRKDYAYLFERYYAFLSSRPDHPYGLVVFDELEKTQCHLLIDQMSRYFRQTRRGQMRAGRIIPEPFFVHSHLTTAIQLADILAYIIAWGLRFSPMNKPARPELKKLADQVMQLRFNGEFQETVGQPYPLYGFIVYRGFAPLRGAQRENLGRRLPGSLQENMSCPKPL